MTPREPRRVVILGILIIIALAIRLAVGRPLKGIGEAHFRAEKLLLAVFVTMLAMPFASRLLHLTQAAILSGWLGLIAALLGVCLMNSREYQGFRVMAAGVALNLLVIASNLGMPVRADAVLAIASAADLRAASINEDVFHLLATPATRLAVLSDVLPLPGPRGLRSVQSVGDLLMFVGILIVVVSAPSSARAALLVDRQKSNSGAGSRTRPPSSGTP